MITVARHHHHHAAVHRGGRCSEGIQTLRGKDARRGSGGRFCYWRHATRFRQIRRAGNGGHSGPPERPRPHGRLYERGGLPENRRDGLRHFLEPLAAQAVAEGRDLGPPARGARNLHRLRPRRRARQGGGPRSGVCHEGYRSCFYRRLENGAWVDAESRSYDPDAVYGGKA